MANFRATATGLIFLFGDTYTYQCTDFGTRFDDLDNELR